MSSGMRIVIAGTRDIPRSSARTAIERYLLPLIGGRVEGGITVASGESGNVDNCARELCASLGVRFLPFVADWSGRGKSAGPFRNENMATWAVMARRSELLALWDGRSTGTQHMILTAHRAQFSAVYSEIIRSEPMDLIS